MNHEAVCDEVSAEERSDMADQDIRLSAHDPELDFRGPMFNPAKALAVDLLDKVPAPHVRHLDSIVKAEYLLPLGLQPLSLKRRQKVLETESSSCEPKSELAMSREVKVIKNKDLELRYHARVESTKRAAKLAVDECCKHLTVAKTPLLKIVEEAVRDRSHLRVVTLPRRNALFAMDGIPVWFDSFWNILLKDVTHHVTGTEASRFSGKTNWVVIRLVQNV